MTISKNRHLSASAFRCSFLQKVSRRSRFPATDEAGNMKKSRGGVSDYDPGLEIEGAQVRDIWVALHSVSTQHRIWVDHVSDRVTQFTDSKYCLLCIYRVTRSFRLLFLVLSTSGTVSSMYYSLIQPVELFIHLTLL